MNVAEILDFGRTFYARKNDVWHDHVRCGIHPLDGLQGVGGNLASGLGRGHTGPSRTKKEAHRQGLQHIPRANYYTLDFGRRSKNRFLT